MTTPYPIAPRPRVDPEILAPVTLWRLVVAACGLYGAYLILGGQYTSNLAELEWDHLYELSQLGSLVVGLCYLGLALWPLFTLGRSHEPRNSWLRGALAVVMLLVSLTSIIIIGPKLHNFGFLFEHLITPLVVVVDFVFVGRGQYRTHWWFPFTWLALPLAYFVFLLSTGIQSYHSIFNPEDSMFYPIVAAFLASLIAVGFVLYGLTKLLGLAFAPKPAPSTPPPPPMLWPAQQQ